MLLAGDEMGRTQQGNNNAYCQDNEISWVHWGPSPDAEDLTRYLRHLIALRRGQPVLTRRQLFQGRPIRGGGVKDITWFEPNGREMSDEEWDASSMHGLGVRLLGTEIEEVDELGDPIAGDTLFLMFNAHHEAIAFVLPGQTPGQDWERLLDTSETDWSQRVVQKDSGYSVAGRSVVVFRLVTPPVPEGTR
jgi:glycogen operon protein